MSTSGRISARDPARLFWLQRDEERRSMPRATRWVIRGMLSLLALTVAGDGWAQSPPPGQNSINGASARTELGLGLFQQRCLSCHGRPEYERAPSPAALREMSPEHLYEVLSTGIMFPVIGNQLSDGERRMVSESIAGRLMGAAQSGDASKMPNRCPSNPPLGDPQRGPAWNGWGATLGNTRFQTAAAAGLDAEQVRHLALRWAFGFPDGSSAYGQPSIVSGRVFVGADTGYVYSLDERTGCVYWSFLAQAGVRNAMNVQHVSGKSMVFFGDVKGNVYGLDAHNGVQQWSTHVDEHITARVTAAPAYYEKRLYVPISSWEEFRAADPSYSCCTSVGALTALDAVSGKTLWKTYVIAQRPQPVRKNEQGVQQYAPAGGAVWNTPTIDPKRHAVYIGTGDATTYPAADTSDAIMAFDMASGHVLWSYRAHKNDSFLVGCAGNAATPSDNCPKTIGPDWDIPGSVILQNVGRQRELIAGTKPGDILALDPDRGGALLWRKNVSGGALAGDGPAFPSGTRVGVQWGGAASADSVYYGLTDGGVVALSLTSGERLWFSPLNRTAPPKSSNAAAITALPGVLFAGGTDGMVFAISTRDGAPLWSFNTAQRFETVNQVPAKGGSISAPGATVADGMVFIGSGYSTTSGEPGNVLLAFAPQ
jgi:polyvinyl alcohol dehydrogenase (cytochrome)